MLRRKNLVQVSAVVLATLTAACSTLPSDGPSGSDVISKAAVRVQNRNGSADIPYVLVDLNRTVLNTFRAPPTGSLGEGFGTTRSAAPSVPLGIGDVVQVTIFESQSGGLFIPPDAGSRPGNYIQLPQQVIDKSGTLAVPYAGVIRASGRTVSAVQRDIEQALAKRAIEPQVIITLVSGPSSRISVLGDVNTPGQFQVGPSGQRVIDAISLAGGLRASIAGTPGPETYVTIEGHGRKATALFTDLIAKPNENIFLLPGDTVYVNRDRRTYVIFGALNQGLATQSGRIDFDESSLTLGEALGKAGGLVDDRADPSYVFLYRLVDRRSLQAVGANVSGFADTQIPVVFRANLRDPAMLFAVQQFPMQDKDVIYVSNAPAVEYNKLLTYVNSISATPRNLAADAHDIRYSTRP